MKREIGYYWVRDKNGWSIAEFRITAISKSPVWIIMGTVYERRESDFFEIDERKIERNPLP